MTSVEFLYVSISGKRVYEAKTIKDMFAFAKKYKGEYLANGGRLYCMI